MRRWSRCYEKPPIPHRTVDRQGASKGNAKETVLGIAPWRGLCWVSNCSYFRLIYFTLCVSCWQKTHDAWTGKGREAFPNKKVLTCMLSANHIPFNNVYESGVNNHDVHWRNRNWRMFLQCFQKLRYPRTSPTLGNLPGVKLKDPCHCASPFSVPSQ